LLEHGIPSILVNIEGMSQYLILDTSSISILQPGILRCDVKVTSLKPYAVTGEVLDIKGRQSVSFELDGCQSEHEFLVCSLPTEVAGLMGNDWMAKAGTIIDFEYGSMALKCNSNVSLVCDAMPMGHSALTIFMNVKGHSLRHAQWEERALGNASSCQTPPRAL